MQVMNLYIEANISFKDDEIETFLTLCEGVINNITDNSDTNYKIKSAVHELLINSLEHGYKKTSGPITLSIKKAKKKILFEISDNGKGLDLSKIDLNRTVHDLESVSSRGWGLALTNKMSDCMKITKNAPSGTKISLEFST